MLYLYTGLPGSKKTANVIHLLLNDPLFKHRPVYYFNLNGCTIDHWIELNEEEVKKWYELPYGSIIFIDEGQEIFRPQKWDKQKPDYITRLEKNRHDGLDIFITTQHPMFIDTHVRRLVEEHRHLHNAFGLRSLAYIWPRCKDDPESNFSTATTEKANVPKITFTYYESTKYNTKKLRVPKKLYFIIALSLVVIGGFAYIYSRFTPDRSNISTQQPTTNNPEHVSTSVGSPLSSISQLTSTQRSKPEPMTTEEYIDQFTPRIPQIPWSAPAYDDLMKPTVAPVPHCIIFDIKNSSDRDCRCFTQQMTRLDMPIHDCKNIVNRGLWNPAPRVQTADFNSSGQPTHYNGRSQSLF